MMELRDLLNRLWYSADIVIAEYGKINFDLLPYGVEEEKDNFLFIGKNSEMNSCLYKHLLCKEVRSFGTIDGYIIIVIC